MSAAHFPRPAVPGQTAAHPPCAHPAPRHMRRERDFGIGYGNSSGYGRDKRYVRDSGQALFRFR